jgi:transposase-like protein
MKVTGRWVYLDRAIDQVGQVIDVLVAEKRDLAATRRSSPAPSNTCTVPEPRESVDLLLCRQVRIRHDRRSCVFKSST